MTQATFTAFVADALLCSGAATDVALAAKANAASPVLIFEDATGRQIDFDLRGSDDEIVARLTPAAQPRPRGRPKLGVVAREVTLLPRHWDWLGQQPGGASVALRKLVDTARAVGEGRAAIRRAQEAADRVMGALLGNQPNYEEASRALYAGDRSKFLALTDPWPADLRDYVRRQAAPAFS
ncbi:MAG: DUF2239 family protein [Hyphomicrobiales bacterium]|nr:DUF2239 family protein [Hyphomicrobiales bacterium]